MIKYLLFQKKRKPHHLLKDGLEKQHFAKMTPHILEFLQTPSTTKNKNLQ